MPADAFPDSVLQVFMHIKIRVMTTRCLFALFLWVLSGPVLTAPLVNRLSSHPSPYLALHGNDPVAWQQWSADAIERAREENKLLFLSVGYFACHWCHVMQRESYQNSKIAQFINQNFIPVKIDRELEPALDAQMMEFVERTQGRGGWPLNVFLTPQGYPLYAALYMPPANFENLIIQLGELWKQDPERLAGIARVEAVSGTGPGAPELSADTVADLTQRLVSTSLQNADPIHGGFGSQNKFPNVPQLQFLLNQYRRDSDRRIREVLEQTLDEMAKRGLFDHIGGGFFRYTVDPDWETPHFEKMLYDNALLARLYLRAGDTLERDDYIELARRSLDFAAREMRHENGALYASFSAVDSRDVEGGYYLWEKEELKTALNEEEYAVVSRVWRMQDPPALDHGYLPMFRQDIASIAGELGKDAGAVAATLGRAYRKLQSIRDSRGLPVDTKLLAGWNGLALAAFSDAALVLNEPRYREVAAGIYDYLSNTLWDGRQLRRAVSQGDTMGQVSLEDYAYVSDGILAWAELTHQDQAWRLLEALVGEAWRRFFRNGWALAEEGLIPHTAVRDVLMDGPMPAPSAVLARVSLSVALRTRDAALMQRVLSALNSGNREIEGNPFWFATQIDVMNLAQTLESNPVFRQGRKNGS